MADKAPTVTDKETGIKIHYLTSGSFINTTGYPTNHTWSADSRYIFIESTRPRPDRTNASNERQLLKIDIKTGETIHLASFQVEDTHKYGNAHIKTSSQFHFDYSPKANVIVYYDMTGHNMYLLDIATGKSKRILHENYGTIGDPPSISCDGKRIVYYVLYPSIPNRFLSGVTSVIFALDVDPVELKAINDPKFITVYPGRIIESVKNLVHDGVLANHCQIDPKDSNHYCYAHEFQNATPDGSLTLTRTWENRNGIDKPVYIPMVNEWQTHEVIGPFGKELYFIENWGVSAVDFNTHKKRRIYDNQKLKPCHITLSPDEKWIAADMFDGSEPDANGCYQSGILLIEATTGKSKILCRTKRGLSHPRHPHPNFSPDGTKIAFTIADGKNTSQVAYVDITDIIKNW